VIEKLKSRLTKAEGFTLIELLIVIAIIAILVVIVIVAINPVQRLADATDRQAASNVRSTGTLVATCATQRLAAGDTATTVYGAANTGCALITSTTLLGFGTPAAGTTIDPSAVAATDVCVSQQGATAGSAPHWYNYRFATSGTPTSAGAVLVNPGLVQVEAGTMPATAAGRCP
jgi:prepilin-type N-terminal cleavage/methylation domain-containing protein